MNIDKLISIIRENMVVGGGGFTGSSPAEGPTAGFDPLLGFRNKKKGNVDFRRVPKDYKSWVKSLKNK
jgi:hypothetical protein